MTAQGPKQPDRPVPERTYLGMLFGAEPEGAYVELRYHRPRGGMGQEFLEGWLMLQLK